MSEQDDLIPAPGTAANTADSFPSVRQLLEQAAEDAMRHAALDVDQQKAVRHATMRATEIGLLMSLATTEQQKLMQSEIKALAATLATIGEVKAIELAQLITSRLNSVLSRGIDLLAGGADKLADRIIGPD